MNTRKLIALVSVALAACQERPQTPAGEMTTEEHERMLAGEAAPRAATAPAVMPGSVHLTPAQAAAIGVAYTTVLRGPLAREVRTVGRVVPAEPRIAEVTARIDGFADSLFASATGLLVRKGDRLVALYSPMLVSAQEELITALRLARTLVDSPAARENADQLVTAARRRLEYWDIDREQIARLERSGAVTKHLTLTAPFDGVILDKMVVVGQAVMPGMRLYRLADLSAVWIEGDVYEQDLPAMRVGAPVRAEIAAYPGQAFPGRVEFVWPVLDEESRTGRVRVAVPNRAGLLKPGMYATLLLDALVGADVLSLPAEAVVMTGRRNLVFVALPDGSFEPREVILGGRAGSRVQILRGLAAGDRVVASGNFLVDAESRIGTAGMAGMPGMPGMGAPAAADSAGHGGHP